MTTIGAELKVSSFLMKKKKKKKTESFLIHVELMLKIWISKWVNSSALQLKAKLLKFCFKILLKVM